MTLSTVIHKTGLGISLAGCALAILGALMQSPALWQPGLVMMTAGLAAGAGYWPGLRSYQFTLWIIAGFVAAMTWSTDLIVWCSAAKKFALKGERFCTAGFIKEG